MHPNTAEAVLETLAVLKLNRLNTTAGHIPLRSPYPLSALYFLSIYKLNHDIWKLKYSPLVGDLAANLII